MVNNYFKWFHVVAMKSTIEQIRWLRSRATKGADGRMGPLARDAMPT
jgi:hypothetical protein